MSREWLCECGRTLANKQEKKAGLCNACQNIDLAGYEKLKDEQLNEEEPDPYEGHEHCDPERASARIDAAVGQEKDRGLFGPCLNAAGLEMRSEDRRLFEEYGIDAGLARDDERQRRGNKECS